MEATSRLTTALALFLDCRARGEDPKTFVARHPELADLLEPMFAEEASDDEPTFGDYRLGREIGRGGMGVVHEARHLALDRRVALKLLAPEVAASPTQIARLQREARALARLDHPHVVRVLDVGETRGQHWLALEFVDGESLEQHLDGLQARGGHTGASRRLLVEIACAIADALQHVHEAGILHRDVKPSNILLDKQGRARLTDFGLAREASGPAMTQVGVVAGTPHFMSPEHLEGGDALGPASDVFSLGATLYQCLVLRRPFDGDTTAEVLRAIVTRDALDPRRIDPTLPRDLAAIVLRALEKDPARRYPTARAFAADLRAFLELRPVEARPPSLVLRVRRWARREPLQAALAAVLVASLALGAVVLAQLPAVREAERIAREQEYEDAITAGDMARIANDQTGARAAFARARALFPDRTEAVVWECLALSQFDGPASALQRLEDACGTTTSDEAVEGLRAFLLTSLNRKDEAAAVVARIGPPTTPNAMLFTATTLLVRGQPGDQDRASQLMSLAVRMSKRPRLFLYACWAGIAPPEQRQECADAILTLWPDNPLALQQAALCLAPTDPARAAALMREALAAGVLSNNPHQLLAAMAWRAGDRETAVAAARDALAKDRLDDDLKTRLIEHLLRLADPAVATAELAVWLAHEPDNPTALRLRARELASEGDLDAALAHVERALAIAPADADLGQERAALLAQAGRRTEATALLAELAAAHPAHVGIHRALTTAYRDGGDVAGLVREARRWAALRGVEAEACFELAAALLQEGTGASLLEAIDAAANADYLLDGKHVGVLELKARIHDALGEVGPAQRCRARVAALRAATSQEVATKPTAK